MDWNPIHWLKDALGDVKRPLDSIEKWVLKRIAQAGGLIENDIRKAANAVWSHFHDVGNTISHLAGQINNLAAAAGKDVGVSISWLTHEVDTLVGDAVGAAQKSLGALAKDAEGWLHDAESYADTALSTFDRDVLAPAISGLHTALKDIEAAPVRHRLPYESDPIGIFGEIGLNVRSVSKLSHQSVPRFCGTTRVQDDGISLV